MTDQIPPPPPPETAAAPGGGAPTRGRSSRRVIIAGVAAVVLLAFAGGAFAVYKKLDGGGSQPHDVLPASVIAYARMDVDPSASQKVALLKLVRKFPKAADELGIKSADQDVRKLLFDEVLKDADCDLTYDKDVEPWLGSRVGFGLDKEQTPLVAIQVKDEDKAKAGIKELFACGDSGDKASVAFLDGYAIVAEKQKTADAAVASAEKKPLAEVKRFADDLDALGEQGVASAWVDAEGLIDQVPEIEEALEESSAAELEELKQAGSAAMAVRTDGSTLEVAGITGMTDSLDTVSPAPIGKLPADTVAAMSVGGLGDQVVKQYDTLMDQLSSRFGSGGVAREPATIDPSMTEGMTPEQKKIYEDLMRDRPGTTGKTPEDYVADFEAETGLQVPEDLETLLGDGLTVAVGSENLEKIPTLEGPEDVTSLDVALGMTTDPAKGFDLAKRLAVLAARSGITLSTAQTDDGAVIATNQDAADALDGSGGLGKDDTFTSVMPFGDETTYGLFVDVATIVEKIREADPPEDVEDDLAEVDPLRAVGLSAGKKGDHAAFSIRVAFSK